MPGPEPPPGTTAPPRYSILSQGAYLIVSIHTALDDGDLTRLQHDLVDTVGRARSLGVVVDVSALDVLDSFATRTLTQIAHALRLRGAQAVVVGIAPDVAMAMVQLSLRLDFAVTALDLEEGLERLDDLTGAVIAAPRMRPDA
jgi:rsbT antagonist protein RsbS